MRVRSPERCCVADNNEKGVENEKGVRSTFCEECKKKGAACAINDPSRDTVTKGIACPLQVFLPSENMPKSSSSPISQPPRLAKREFSM